MKNILKIFVKAVVLVVLPIILVASWTANIVTMYAYTSTMEWVLVVAFGAVIAFLALLWMRLLSKFRIL